MNEASSETEPQTQSHPRYGSQRKQASPEPLQRPAPEAYWLERKQYLANIRAIPELRRRYAKALLIYLLRRFLWSFGFFPIFIAFWVPLVMSWFDPVVMVTNLLPSLKSFVNANPEVQAHTEQTILMAWLSIGFFFAVFDFVLTPFKSPYQYEADVHMRIWEERQTSDKAEKRGEAES